MMEALKPLGADYAAARKPRFNERWIDLYPTPGKRSGAYSNGGAYDVHPYMLINYNGKYNDISTLAHELGPHDALLPLEQDAAVPARRLPDLRRRGGVDVQRGAAHRPHAQDRSRTMRRSLSLLGNYLEGIKGTVFRQTQFAEFELRMHEMAEKGEPLTGDALSKLYADITQEVLRPRQGRVHRRRLHRARVGFIPHFYRNFYVFQYATSFTASAALSEKVLAGDPAATKRYLTFLSAGGSKYPDRSAEGRRRGHDHRRAARR